MLFFFLLKSVYKCPAINITYLHFRFPSLHCPYIVPYRTYNVIEKVASILFYECLTGVYDRSRDSLALCFAVHMWSAQKAWPGRQCDQFSALTSFIWWQWNPPIWPHCRAGRLHGVPRPEVVGKNMAESRTIWRKRKKLKYLQWHHEALIDRLQFEADFLTSVSAFARALLTYNSLRGT